MEPDQELSNVSDEQPFNQGHLCINNSIDKSHLQMTTPYKPNLPATNAANFTKDSGIGTTQYASSSEASSTRTSPDQEKEVKRKLLPLEASTPPNKRPRLRLDSLEEDQEAEEEEISTPTSTTVMSSKHINVHNVADETFVAMSSKVAEPAQLLWRLVDDDMTTTTTTETDTTTTETDTTQTQTRTADNPRRYRRTRQIHRCQFCGKEFDRPSLLQRHVLTHTGERPFKCEFCHKGFNTKSSRVTHERTHTGERPYACDLCGRCFTAGSNLISHKLAHTNKRRHQCSHCSKAFVNPGELRKHEYTHNGEWPFSCEDCDRGFASERDLRTHEIIHTGAKPFKCNACTKAFSQQSSLKNHTRCHKSDKSAPSNQLRPALASADDVTGQSASILPSTSQSSPPLSSQLPLQSSSPPPPVRSQENHQIHTNSVEMETFGWYYNMALEAIQRSQRSQLQNQHPQPIQRYPLLLNHESKVVRVFHREFPQSPQQGPFGQPSLFVTPNHDNHHNLSHLDQLTQPPSPPSNQEEQTCALDLSTRKNTSLT